MTDIVNQSERSRIMAAIKSNDTKPEMLVRRYLHRRGFRYGLHNKKLPGSPDIVLRRYKTIIFIHGCFWHGHEDCKLYKLPSSNVEFWQSKIERNRARDERVQSELRDKGWRVITIWECELKTKLKREQTFHRLLCMLNGAYFCSNTQMEETNLAAEPESPYKSV